MALGDSVCWAERNELQGASVDVKELVGVQETPSVPFTGAAAAVGSVPEGLLGTPVSSTSQDPLAGRDPGIHGVPHGWERLHSASEGFSAVIPGGLVLAMSTRLPGLRDAWSVAPLRELPWRSFDPAA